jgi:hypothetical protein
MMIKVEYVCYGEEIAAYTSGQFDSRTLVIPRQGESVEIDDITYLVENIKHKFSVRRQILNTEETVQRIVVNLSQDTW